MNKSFGRRSVKRRLGDTVRIEMLGAVMILSSAFVFVSGCSPEGAGSVPLDEKADAAKRIANPELPRTPGRRVVKDRPVPKGLRLPGDKPPVGQEP
jgi:hypothetical protein